MSGTWARLETGSNSRDGKLKSVDGMAEFPVQGPGYALVKGLDGVVGLLGDVAHDRMHHLALVVPLFTLYDIFGGNTTL